MVTDAGADAVDRIRRIKAALGAWDDGESSAVEVVAQIEAIAAEPWTVPRVGDNYKPEVQT